MKTPPPPKANRNDPCPCGSGKKFKHCCLGKVEAKSRSLRTPLLVAGLGALVVAGVVVANRPSPPSRSPQPTAAPVPSAALPSTTPAPWQYDPVSNRHWDPGHGHWHDGPPPRQPATSEVSTTTTFSGNATNPPAWFFDAAANRHWHPEHQHWHDGPPPNAASDASAESTAGWDIVIEPDGDPFDDFRLPSVLP